MTLIACCIVWAAYERAISHLYAMPEPKTLALVALTQTALYAIAAISSAYVGVTGWIQARQNVSSAVTQTISETFEHVPAPKHFDDGSVE